MTTRWKLPISYNRCRANSTMVCFGVERVRLSPPARLVILFCLAAAVSLSGCVAEELQQKKKTDLTQAQKLPRMIPLSGISATARKTRIPYIIRIRMITVQVPTGMVSKSEELWSYLDEEPVSMKSAVLGLNGIRVGKGRGGAWPDVERMLKKMTGQIYDDRTIQTFGGQARLIELKMGQPEQTICTFREDRTLFGADYPRGDNMLAVSCTVNEDDYNEVILTAVPQIRTTKQFTQYVQKYGTLQAVTKPKLYSFELLTFQLALSNNDFLIIAPGIESRRLTSLGHHFLTEKLEGIEHETILVLLPKVHRIKYKE